MEDSVLRRAAVWLGAVVAGSAVWMAGSSSVFGWPSGESSNVVDGSPIIIVLPKDAIPAIDEPRFVSVREAGQLMAPDEAVLGITDGTIAKAYSLWQLNHHEIVNDRLGTLPVAVTW